MVDLFLVGPLEANVSELRIKSNIVLRKTTFDKNICNIIAILLTLHVLNKLQNF